MTTVEIETYEPGSADWLQQRATRLGGSEIAAVLGLSPYESPFSLWHRKAGAVAQQDDKPELEWGRRLEAAVREKWLELHADTHALFGTGETFVHADRPWMLASPDARVVPHDTDMQSADCEVLEIKTSPYGEGWARPEDGADGVPVYYLAQVRWYLGTLGLRRAHVAVLIGGCDYREYVVDQDDADLQQMIIAAAEFMGSLTDGRRPDIDAHSATYQVVRELHPEIDPVDVTVTADLATAYRAALIGAKAADVEKQHQSARLLDAMGDARNAIDPTGQRIAYRAARQSKAGEPGTPYLVADRSVTATPKTTIRKAAA